MKILIFLHHLQYLLGPPFLRKHLVRRLPYRPKIRYDWKLMFTTKTIYFTRNQIFLICIYLICTTTYLRRVECYSDFKWSCVRYMKIKRRYSLSWILINICAIGSEVIILVVWYLQQIETSVVWKAAPAIVVPTYRPQKRLGSVIIGSLSWGEIAVLNSVSSSSIHLVAGIYE